MSVKRFFYTDSLSIEVDRVAVYAPVLDDNNNNDDNFDDSEFLQDVPYSSSSMDRSSIGSIPWADDAIKQNQLDWESVERMLSGEQPLPVEPELRNELQEWQRKFPQLIGNKRGPKHPTQQGSFDSSRTEANLEDSLELDLISNLSLNSLDDGNNDANVNATPTMPHQETTPINQPHATTELAQLLQRNLHISALPLRQRYDRRTVSQQLPPQPPAPKPMHIMPPSPSVTTKHHPTLEPHTNTRSRLHMPPILNVLETKRRFRNLTTNQSFVQLTQVPVQPKSAAITTYIQPEHTFFGQVQQKQRSSAVPAPAPLIRQFNSAWHRPLVAARLSKNFFNNRNAIILPALNPQRIGEQQQASSSSHDDTTGTRTRSLLSNSSVDSSAGGVTAATRRQPTQNYSTRWQAHDLGTSTSTTTRSVSAAVHQPRLQFGTIYVPYSASKFKGFK